jgi:hypothetical protein
MGQSIIPAMAWLLGGALEGQSMHHGWWYEICSAYRAVGRLWPRGLCGSTLGAASCVSGGTSQIDARPSVEGA